MNSTRRIPRPSPGERGCHSSIVVDSARLATAWRYEKIPYGLIRPAVKTVATNRIGPARVRLSNAQPAAIRPTVATPTTKLPCRFDHSTITSASLPRSNRLPVFTRAASSAAIGSKTRPMSRGRGTMKGARKKTVSAAAVTAAQGPAPRLRPARNRRKAIANTAAPARSETPAAPVIDLTVAHTASPSHALGRQVSPPAVHENISSRGGPPANTRSPVLRCQNTSPLAIGPDSRNASQATTVKRSIGGTQRLIVRSLVRPGGEFIGGIVATAAENDRPFGFRRRSLR